MDYGDYMWLKKFNTYQNSTQKFIMVFKYNNSMY